MEEIVNGINVFREAFAPFADSFIVIGGSACRAVIPEHRNINAVIGKTQCVSNQLGYVFSGEHRNISVPEPAESK